MDSFILGCFLFVLCCSFLVWAVVRILSWLISRNENGSEEEHGAGQHRSKAARQLRHLEITENTIQSFLTRNEIAQKQADAVLECIRNRREEIENAPARRASARAGRRFQEVVEQPTPRAELEALLFACRNVNDLTENEVRRARRLYTRLSRNELRELTPTSLCNLARLLHHHESAQEALGVFEVLLEQYPSWSGLENALQGAVTIALENELRDEARWWLEQVLNHSHLTEHREEARRLLLELDKPVSEAAVVEDLIPLEEVEETLTPEIVPEPEESHDPGKVSEPVTSVPEPEPPVHVPVKGPPAPTPPPEPTPPRRSWGDLLAGFMEERNILWGELVGGLLIVGCSIALVVTLWQTLERIPYFPFLIFAGINLAIFGAGKYSFHHWKLESTSRGLLIISTLLVPLSLLVLAALSRSRDPDLYQLFAFLGSIVGFGYLVQSTGLVLDRAARGWLALGVVGAASVQLAVPSLVDTNPWTFLLMGLCPVALHGVSVLGRSRQIAPEGLVTRSDVSFTVMLIGIVTFAVAVTFGFLLANAPSLSWGVHQLAIPITVASLPFLLIGFPLEQRVRRQISESSDQETTSSVRGLLPLVTAISLTGMVVLLGGILSAWPESWATLATCTIGWLVLTILALRDQLPYAHALAIPCLTLGYLASWNSGSALVPEMFLTQATGEQLTLLVVFLTGMAEVLTRRGQRDHALYVGLGSVALAALSLGVVTSQGTTDSWTLTRTYLIYSVTIQIVNLRLRKPWLGHAGLIMGLIGSLWFLEKVIPDQRHLWTLVLAGEALLLAVLALIHRQTWLRTNAQSESGTVPWHQTLTAPCRNVSVLAIVLAIVPGLLDLRLESTLLCTVTPLILGTALFCLTWTIRRPITTWLGAIALWFSLTHLIQWDFSPPLFREPWSASFLLHASLMTMASLILQRRFAEDDSAISRLYQHPLASIAIWGTGSAALTLILNHDADPGGLALNLVWLGGIWAVRAWLDRSTVSFTLFQTAWTAAVIALVTSWLETNYFPMSWERLSDPRVWLAYTFGLSLISFFWAGSRLLSDRKERFRQLFSSMPVTFDLVITGALTLGLFGLACTRIAPEVFLELWPADLNFSPFAANPGFGEQWSQSGAWGSLCMLGITLLMTLWTKYRRVVPYGLVILTLTVPVLLAAEAQAQLASASALRWGLAITMLLLSITIWLHVQIRQLSRRMGIEISDTPSRTRLLQALVLTPTLGTILVITFVMAFLGFVGMSPSGPLPGSFFAQLGFLGNYLTPLAVACVVLVGYALRERSPIYAFSAGLLTNLVLVGGYLLAMVTAGQPLNTPRLIRALQIGGTVAGAWALLWLVSRRWVATWRELPAAEARRSAKPLMLAQLGLASILVLVLLTTGLVPLLLDPTDAYASWLTALIGNEWSGIAVLMTLTALMLRQRQLSLPINEHALGVVLVGVLGFFACAIESAAPGWGYRGFMLGLAFQAVLSSLIVRRSPDTPRTSDWGEWVSGLTVAVLILTVGVIRAFGDQVLAAIAIVTLSVAHVIMAIRERHETWLFKAGLGLCTSASLLVWHVHQNEVFGMWWPLLVQANVITMASFALACQWANRRWAFAPWDSSPVSVLQLQSRLGVAIKILFLLYPVIELVLEPRAPLSKVSVLMGQVWGWVAFGLSLLAMEFGSGWQRPRDRTDFRALAILMLGILGACLVSPWTSTGWIPYRLLLGWVSSMGLACAALVAIRPTSSGDGSYTAQDSSTSGWLPWAWAFGVAAILFALRVGWTDPSRPWASSLALFAVLLGTIVLAFSQRQQVYVHLSGLMATLIALLFWVTWGIASTQHLALTICCALGAVAFFWQVLEQRLQRPYSSYQMRDEWMPFAHVGSLLAVVLFAMVVIESVLDHLQTGATIDPIVLAWSALIVLTLALIASLWDSTAWFSLPGLYLMGLLAIALMMDRTDLSSRWYFWTVHLVLACYVLLTTLLARSRLRFPAAQTGQTWYLPTQITIGLCVLCLSVWTSIDFPTTVSRMAGPFSLIVLTLATIIPRTNRKSEQAEWARLRTLTLGTLLLCEIGWAWTQPMRSAPALRGAVVVVTALVLAMATCLYGMGLFLRAPVSWKETTYRFAHYLSGIAVLALLITMGMETLQYDPVTKVVPLLTREFVLLAVAIPGLIAMLLHFALTSETNPFGLIAPPESSETNTENPWLTRTIYVYLSELFLLLLFLHVKLNVPDMFDPRWGQYWTFSVVIIAMIGTGLGELCHRRGLEVLARPLLRTGFFLPVLPLLAFWIRPPLSLLQQAEETAPGVRPMLDYLYNLPQHFDNYALLWIMLGGLYGFLALSRKSFRFALLAALAANFGLWALWAHFDVSILVHPQMWLIPLAIIILVSEQVNREHLSREQSLTLRYVGLGMLYLSSTADMFLAGLGGSVWMPIVLALLSVLGGLMGIALRIRAFLLTGLFFLCLDVFAMIWYAAEDRQQTWVWYVSGIVLGAIILGLFAIFEKRRQDVLHVIEKIRGWD